MNLKQYDYHLPETLIAKQPAKTRDASRLFVYDTKSNSIKFDKFYNLGKYLPKDSFFVFNNTKVLPARVEVTKDTGGKVELLFLVNEMKPGDKYLKALSNKKLIVGRKVFINKKFGMKIIRQHKKYFFFRPEFPKAKLNKLLEQYGQAPIPKYIKNSPLSAKELKSRYQAVFAKTPSSIAAPTASLHFSPNLLFNLKKQGHNEVFITLHVGLGTFAPIDESNFHTRKLHQEFLGVTPAAAKKINQFHKNKKLIAVGTTAVRTLESVTDGQGRVKPARKATEMFIFPPYKFKAVDCLITNFHLPQSSLMLLVDAFLKHKKAKKGIVQLYKKAIAKKFRFYSFGDAMLII